MQTEYGPGYDWSPSDRQHKWDLRFMQMARLAASWSKDPSTQVGCVVTADNRVLGIGYNGFPKGHDDDPALYADREYKYKHVVHAEANALWDMDVVAVGATAYVTFPPCQRCCERLWAFGVARIVTKKVDVRGRAQDWCDRWLDEFKRSYQYAESKGIVMEFLDE